MAGGHEEAASGVEPPPAKVGGRRRILVVDDEVLLARLVARVLGRRHDVVVATSGRAARTLLDTDRAFDVVLCDLDLGDQTGAELHAELERALPALAARMIFMTGGASNRRTADFLRATDRPVLAKPFDLPELEAAVRSAPPR